MFFGILVKAGRVGIKQGARVSREIWIFALCRAARIDQVIGVVEHRPVFARNRAIAPARHRDHILQREEIVFGMSDGNAVSDIGISVAIDHRHAIFVAHDLSRVFAVFGRFASGGEERLPRREADKCDNQQCNHGDKAALDPFHGVSLRSLLTRQSRGN